MRSVRIIVAKSSDMMLRARWDDLPKSIKNMDKGRGGKGEVTNISRYSLQRPRTV